MSTPTLIRNVKGLMAAALCGLSVTSCADLARTGRGPAYLIVESVSGARGGSSGAGTFTSSLLSDVITIVDVKVGSTTVPTPTIFNDLGQARLRAEMKNALSPTAPTPASSITINRYRVRFRRTDGQNREGIDVPYGFDGGTTVTIPVGGSALVNFDLVRHQAKSEPPLVTLVGGRGLIFLSAIAEVTFYGQDQAGNAVSVSGTIDVQFGDFGDSQ